MKAFEAAREHINRWRQERAIRLADNVIRLADVRIARDTSPVEPAETWEEFTRAQLAGFSHPELLDELTDPKLFDDGRFDGPYEAQIISLPRDRLSSEVSELADGPGKLIIDPRLASRVRPPHGPPNGPNHRHVA